MDFLTNLFTELNTRDSLLVLLFLFIAFLIGLMTGWLYWRSRLEALRTSLTGTQADLSRLKADFDDQALRLTQVEGERKSVQASWDNCRSQLQDCRAEKGQLWADFQALKEEIGGDESEDATEAVGLTASQENSEANPTDPNDLKIIEGIGPKIEELLKAEGIETWGDLASTSETRLREILDAAGDHYRIHDPSTWPRQAALALGNEWEAFREYTDFLKGGREP